MLHFYPSNQTETLATVVTEIMRRKPLRNPFTKETILIQSHGLGTWLQQQISSELGIAAMIETQMPASFIWDLTSALLPDEQLIPLFEKQNLRWQLMQVLPSKLELDNYQPLREYLQHLSQSDELEERALFQLCDRIADLFDAYQNYRSDWIHTWESGGSVIDARDEVNAALEAWQSDLWRSVYGEVELSSRRHRPIMIEKLVAALDRKLPVDLAVLPERLFVFGLSALPPQWITVFEQLSRHIDIHFLVLNPCRQYWGDIQSQPQQLKLQAKLIEQGISPETAAETAYESNPLLASWGRLGRDYVSLIQQSAMITEVPVDLYEKTADESEGHVATALHHLQDDILQLESRPHLISEHDRSLSFQRCHSRLREVEVLHDHLIALLDQPRDLAPKDIIVMMPDVEDYAALIRAVFSRPILDKNGLEHYLPYTVSDQLLAMDQPLIDVMSEILSLGSLRVSATEVLDWLDIDAIRSRFGISQNELEDIHRWISALNIRWGLSEKHRDEVLSQSHSGMSNTWLSAFRRLLGGYLYGEVGLVEEPDSTILTVGLDGSDQQVLLGKLMRFLDVVGESQSMLTGKNESTVWLNTVSELWQNWFDESVLDEQVLRLMDQALTEAHQQIHISGFESELGFTVVADAILGQFEKERVNQRFLAGRINFCTLMPMRSIPFKVICLIGMNEGDYPRQDIKSSFDLMSVTPGRVGDRSRRDDDRYLFLEALCSAREQFYISYCAYDARDNSERFPSILASELREYCQSYFEFDADSGPANRSPLDMWTTDHRLQPFHPDYFDTERKRLPQSYCPDWLPLLLSSEGASHRLGAERVFDTGEVVDVGEDLEINLNELMQFANHPLRYFYSEHMNLRFSGMDTHVENVEPFELDGLTTHQIKQELASNWQNPDRSEASTFLAWKAADALPQAPFDEFSWQPAYEQVATLESRLSELGAIQACEFEVLVSGTGNKPNRIVDGRLAYSLAGHIHLSLSKNVGGQFFGVWIKHLVWNAYLQEAEIESSGNSYFVYPAGALVFKALDSQQAQIYLQAILDWYREARSHATGFLAKTCFAQLFEGVSKVKEAFYGASGRFANQGEYLDPYWQRACSLGDLNLDSEEIPEMGAICMVEQVRLAIENDHIRKVKEGDSCIEAGHFQGEGH